MTSKARQGLNNLLAFYPLAELVDATNQSVERSYMSEPYDPFLLRARGHGPWTCVDLQVEGELRKFAILNRTGSVYRLDEHGAVEDDPFIFDD